MRFLALLFLIVVFQTVNAQPYTRGHYGQLYWDWRPDIADSCYEFTFINYFSSNDDVNHEAYINMFYWDDCNYGKNWIDYNLTTGNCANDPLHDTLFNQTTQFGIIDTFCGFPMPNTYINMTEVNTPERTKVVYKGLFYLPEKCKNWHFALGNYYPTSGAGSQRTWLYTNGTSSFALTSYTNTKANIDSVYYESDDYTLHPSRVLRGIWGCSFNNSDFPNNSSVRFLAPPLYCMQVQKGVEFNPAPYDPDHDSISITIPDTLKAVEYLNFTGPWDPLTFRKNDAAGNYRPDIFTQNFFYSPLPGQTGPNPIRFNSQNNPFDTDSTFHLVDSTGKVTFTSASIMDPVLYYSAKDYRNGKFVSESYCLNQFAIQADGRLPSYMRIDTGSVQNASFNNQGTLLGCKGYPISFDAYVKLPNDPSGDLIVRTTADTTVPGNGVCVLSGLNTDSVHMKFSWTPPMNAKGLYNVFVFAKDSNCNPPYHHYTQVYTWSFYIDSCIPSAIHELVANDELIVYPNPASDEIWIRNSENFGSIKIYNSLSELVYEKKVKPTKQLQLSTKDLPNGMYIIKVDDHYIRKLVIQR